MTCTRFGFELLTEDGETRARRGRVLTPHGIVETPIFMPVGTQGTVKGVTPAQLEEVGAQIILGNTYHLLLRPGPEIVTALGGLHRMAAWPRPILTDSGGFQVYSLRDLSRVAEEGVTFASHLDGKKLTLTPESSVAMQEALGSDIMMAFDECPPAGSEVARVRAAMERTHRWAVRSIEARRREGSALFGIVQGGVDEALRLASLGPLLALPFDGYAIGGLSVGESAEDTYRTVAFTAAHLPTHKPRYLMGVGTPEDLLTCIGHGVDMFDCVMPTRCARNGRMFTSRGELNMRNSRYKADDRPIDPACACYTCRHFSRAYLRHLDKAGEILFSTLATLHNLHYFLNLVAEARARIPDGTFVPWRADVLARRAAGLDA